MQVNSVLQQKDTTEALLKRALLEDKVVHLRMPMQIRLKGQGYTTWKRVSWVFTVEGKREAEALRDTLDQIFQLASEIGLDKVQRRLHVESD